MHICRLLALHQSALTVVSTMSVVTMLITKKLANSNCIQWTSSLLAPTLRLSHIGPVEVACSPSNAWRLLHHEYQQFNFYDQVIFFLYEDSCVTTKMNYREWTANVMHQMFCLLCCNLLVDIDLFPTTIKDQSQHDAFLSWRLLRCVALPVSIVHDASKFSSCPFAHPWYASD